MLGGADHAENCQFLQSHGSVISGISYCGVCPGNAGVLACFAKISALLIVQKQARTPALPGQTSLPHLVSAAKPGLQTRRAAELFPTPGQPGNDMFSAT
jgi:hypothetical protein